MEEMTANNGVQRTRHKVSGPLTPDVVCIKMKFTAIALILALTGCAHTRGPVEVEESEFQIYHDLAIHALNDPDVWTSKFSQVLPFEKREIDYYRSVWFEIRQGEPPIITVCVPVKSPYTRYAYVGFQINHWTGDIDKIVLGQKGTQQGVAGYPPQGVGSPER